MTDFPLTNLTAIILAGGQSSRMGQDKTLLVFDGLPLLTRICQAAQAIATPVYVITPWPERYQAIIPASCQLLQETQPHQGPLIGFAQVLPQVKTEWVLLLACDLPYLTPITLQDWAVNLEKVDSDAIALLPLSDKGWEPLAGFYRISSFPLLQAYIAQGGQSFQGWLSLQAVTELTIGDRSVLFNCNTVKDLEKLSKST
ncbi:MAG: molybdenum cofactor guanylyltransferase [Snowella sp.]|nr:molybdenum cofactor guanylyltransferase [Snowella sp.]